MKRKRLVTLFSGLAILFLLANISHAQTSSDVAARRAQLEAELAREEQAIIEQTKLLQAKQKDVHTVAGEVALLKSQIAQAQANIKTKKASIARLTDEITIRQTKIAGLSERIANEQAALRALLRETRNTDLLSFAELLLANDQLSATFKNVDDFEIIQGALAEAFRALRTDQEQATQEKRLLEEKKDAEIDARQAIETQQKIIQKKEAQQSVVLAINKNQEQAYQKILAERQKRAAQIRAALFGLRDTAAIPFGQALDYANRASQKTGVRPAFLLAVLTQESNLGQNQGSCLLSSLETGDGVGKNTGTPFEKVMKAPRDTVPFSSITTRLGRDWRVTPVSCPVGSARYYSGRGFGGAMGPAQFIPSTWELFKERLGLLVNVAANSVDPWNPEHAFMASALYLGDLGGVNGSYSGEIRAACKYYGSGGSACTYGKQVMAKATDIQLNMIDPLQNN